VRTRYRTLLRRLHAYATVHGYTKNTIGSQGQGLGSRKTRTFGEGRLYKGMFVYFKEVCIALRDFGRNWRCTVRERAMTWRDRQHRHVTVKRKLGNRRIELEVCYQVSCDAIFLEVGAHPPRERYAILRSQVLYNVHKFSLFRHDVSPDLPCSNPNGSSATHVQTAAPR
jgi:hypothetical protein